MAAGSFAVVALALGVVPAQAASPGEPVDGRGAECSFGCSEIQNRSHRKVMVSRDWCGDDPAGAVKKKTWICGKPSDKHPYQYLEPGEHSYGSAYHDTDSFRIDPGYEMHVQWNNDGEEDGPVTVYEKKGYTRWVKVANNHDIDIEAYFKL
ncbi:hypothetical protein ABT324_16895 [Saccharopolyspora sp. NPDC000359]|uniref:hypothetical protein n=1 Tax=Saccharopolyspora sp. NPDC000359 TaxID=3154251 RepID=UPI003317B96A